MEIRNTTKYSLDALLEFNRHHYLKRKKGFWIFYIVCTVFILLAFALYCFMYFQNPTEQFNVYLAYGVIVVLTVDLYYVMFFSFILKKKLKKTPSLDADAECVFTEDEIKETFVSKSFNESLSCKYEGIFLVTENERFLYIYIAPNQAYIIDKNGFTEGSLYDLKLLLSEKVDAKKRKYTADNF